MAVYAGGTRTGCTLAMILVLVRGFPSGNQGNNWRHACASVRQAKGESHSASRELGAAFAGDAGSNSSSAAILAGFANFHGVTVKSTVWLDAAFTLRSLHRRFDNVARRQGLCCLFRMQFL